MPPRQALPSANHVSLERARMYASYVGTPRDPWAISGDEQVWVNHQPYLLSKGYALRRRYQPGWVRSWSGTTLDPTSCEDSLKLQIPNVIDARRVSDGNHVMIKLLDISHQGGQDELHILTHLSSHHIKHDPRNHCICAYDSFPAPHGHNQIFVVMPVLRKVTDVPFETVGQMIDFMGQLLEGLEFMHELNLAHRDCTLPNIMMQGAGLFSEEPHPSPSYSRVSSDGRRVIHPAPRKDKVVRYRYIDYGISRLFPSYENRHHIVSTQGSERRLPELSTGRPYDPFKADVYILGELLRSQIIPSSRYLACFDPVAQGMTAEAPDSRTSAARARHTFKTVLASVPPRYFQRALDPGAVSHMLHTLEDLFQSMFARVCQLLACYRRAARR